MDFKTIAQYWTANLFLQTLNHHKVRFLLLTAFNFIFEINHEWFKDLFLVWLFMDLGSHLGHG